MNSIGLTKNFEAEGQIHKYRIVKAGSDERKVVQANGAAGIIGVTGSRGAKTAGDRVDVVLSGIHSVEFGADIPAWSWITADAEGRAVVAGATSPAIGRALEKGVAGAYGDILICHQR